MSSIMTFHDQSGADSMPADHHYSHHNDVSGDDGDFFDKHPVVEAIFCYGWLFVLFYCMLKAGRGEPPSTEVGDRIRARAREAQESIQQKKIKEEQSPEERKRIVDENMVSKVVLSKDSEGNLTLGVKDSQEASNDDVEAQQGDVDDSKNLTHLEADDEEGLTCVICLDCFEPGDLVSWTKHDPNCKHVFHDECIRQWLEERRQDECPSCRCHLVPPVEVPLAKSLEEDGGDSDQEELAETDADSSATSSAEPKEDADSALFVMMRELLQMATSPSSTRRPPSAPSSGNYNLVSVNSASFDSQDAPEQVQDPEDPPQHQPLDAESPSPSSSSPSDDDEESSQQNWLSSVASVETMSISEALRQSEAMEEEDGEENYGAVELDMQDAVTQIPFSSP